MNKTKKQTQKKKEYAWVCNECGAEEYSMSVSEEDVQKLGCGGCGANEFHKELVKHGT